MGLLSLMNSTQFLTNLHSTLENIYLLEFNQEEPLEFDHPDSHMHYIKARADLMRCLNRLNTILKDEHEP